MRRERKTYSDDFKINLIREFQSGNAGIHEFVSKKNLSESTFKKWLEIYRLANTLEKEKNIRIKNSILIDVTDEAKEIIKESNTNPEQKIDFEINGIKLTLSLKNLKIVLEAIQNDWT